MINIRIYLFLLGGTVLLFLLLRYQGRPLNQFQTSPMGIVNLELARKADQANDIIAHWNQAGILTTARRNVILDFLFIPFYSLLFYTLCGSISVRLYGIVSSLGVFLAFGGLVAGCLDVLENILLLFSLNGWIQDWITFIAWGAASVKFLLLSLALVYILIFGLYLLAGKIKKI